MTKADCPTTNALQSLLDEDDAQAGEEILRHLEGCTECRYSLETLAGDSAAWRFTAAGLGQTTRYEPALREVVERLKDEEFLGADNDDLSFLRSTDKPDVLGLLGEYEVQEQIGRGGMGIVLKATDPSLSRTVAIKILSPKLATSALARRRFVREGRAAAKVVHDHIVTVYGVQEAGGLPYLIMQHVEGESLQERLDREGPLELMEIVRIARQAAAGLAAAHAHGLIHRDIKPANLLLEVPRALAPGAAETEGRVKITDFGLARMKDDVQMTQHGMVIGTPEYMAPEQARGDAVDHRADLFSLGSVLYAMCTDRPPFRASSTVAVLRRVSEDEPVPVRSVNPDIPAWLAELVERLMQKNPDDRFQSASEVATLLEAVRKGVGPLPAPAVSKVPQYQCRPRARSLVLLAIAAVLMLVPVALWCLHLLSTAATQDDPKKQPGGAIADNKKDKPAAYDKKEPAPIQAPRPRNVVPATPEQLRAIAILRRVNAKFKFDAPNQPVVHVSFERGTEVDDILEDLLPLQDIGVIGLQGTKITDAGMKHVAGFKRMFQLYLGQTGITDAGLKELANHPRLEHLGLENTHITDKGIHAIANLKTLKYLNIGATPITDACLKDIGGFQQMEMLCLYGTEVTDAGMKELTGLTKLKTLLLNDTAVTDAGLKELGPLKHLRKINAQNTAITEAGLNALKETAPAAKFVAEPGDQPTGSHKWLTAAVMVVVVIALSLAGVFLVFRQRQRGEKTLPPPERSPTKTPSAAVLGPFTCPRCQRRLRAKTDQAGKKVKCPGCGAPVEVPSFQAALPPTKSARSE